MVHSGSPATSFTLTAATPTVTNLGLVGQGGSRRMKIEFVDKCDQEHVVTSDGTCESGNDWTLCSPRLLFWQCGGDVGVGNGQSVATGNFLAGDRYWDGWLGCFSQSKRHRCRSD